MHYSIEAVSEFVIMLATEDLEELCAVFHVVRLQEGQGRVVDLVVHHQPHVAGVVLVRIIKCYAFSIDAMGLAPSRGGQ